MNLVSSLIVNAITCGKHLVGIVNKPYETYRIIATTPRMVELLYVGSICFGYFSFVSLIRVPAFHFYVLTKEIMVLSIGALSGYIAMVVSMWFIGLFVGGKGTISKIAIGWGYTLIPTVLWFLLTSFLYVLFPPPRTESIKGVSFSLLYLIISSVLLFWKIELYYLTLRFGMRLSMKGILVTTCIMIPIISIYTISMYWLGIFRVPFI